MRSHDPAIPPFPQARYKLFTLFAMGLLWSLAVLLYSGAILAQETEKDPSAEPGVDALSRRRFSEKKTLDFNFDSSQYPVRSNAPASVVIKISPTTDSTTELITGTLLLDAYSGPQRLFSAEYHDVVASEQPQRFGLPSMSDDGPIKSIELHVRYRTPDNLFDFDRYMVRVPTPSNRKFCVGVPVMSKLNSTSRLQRFFDTLRLEDFEPKRTDGNREEGIQTQNVVMLASELPQEPTSLCSYDILLLHGTGFTALREEQLEAIATWAAGGGSVIVSVEGRLGLPQVNFLNTILRAKTPVDQFSINADRSLVTPQDDPGPRVVSKPYGIGRALVMWGADSLNDSTLAELLSQTDWRNGVVDAWRIRESHRSTFVSTGKWNPKQIFHQDEVLGNTAGRTMLRWPQSRYPNMYRGLISPFEEAPLEAAPQLVETLMPRTVRLIPLEIVVVMLAGYVLLIGPADYLLLGMWRARKFTWILFPVVTVAATVLTVMVSEHYLSFTEQRRRLTISDIGDENAVVRVNTYELLFLPSSREVSSDATREIVTDLPMSTFGDLSSRLNRAGDLALGADPPRVVGRYPTNFSVKQHIPQTTPRIHRRLSFDPDPALTVSLNGFDWDALRPDFDAQQLAAALKQNGLSHEFHDWKERVLLKASDAVQRITDSEIVPQVDVFIGQHRSRLGSLVFADRIPSAGIRAPVQFYDNSNLPQVNFIHDTARNSGVGLFSLCSQLSPAGGASFEDLVLLDTSNPNLCLVCVTFRWKDELYVYRKRYQLATNLPPILQPDRPDPNAQTSNVYGTFDPGTGITTGVPGGVAPGNAPPVGSVPNIGTIPGQMPSAAAGAPAGARPADSSPADTAPAKSNSEEPMPAPVQPPIDSPAGAASPP